MTHCAAPGAPCSPPSVFSAGGLQICGFPSVAGSQASPLSTESSCANPSSGPEGPQPWTWWDKWIQMKIRLAIYGVCSPPPSRHSTCQGKALFSLETTQVGPLPGKALALPQVLLRSSPGNSSGWQMSFLSSSLSLSMFLGAEQDR